MAIDLATQRGDRRPVSLVGRWYAAEWREGLRPTELIPLGLVGEGSSLKMTEEVTHLPDTENLAGGNAHSMYRANGATVEFKHFDWNRNNMARALYGDDVITPASSQEEYITLKGNGVMIPLARIGAKKPEVFTVNHIPNSLNVGTLGMDEVVFTALRGGAPTIRIINAAQVVEQTTVSVLANRIAITPAHDGTEITATLNDVVSAVNNHPAASLLVVAKVGEGSDPNEIINEIVETSLSGEVGQYFQEADTTWSLDPSGSGLIIPTNTLIPAGSNLVIKYESPAQVRIDSMKGVSKPVSMIGLMQNRAGEGASERIWIYKVQFGIAAVLDLFKKDYNDLMLTGSVMKDTSAKLSVLNGVQTPFSHSDYYHWEFL